MWDLLVTVDEQLAQPLLEESLQLRESGVLQADESPVRMRLEDGKGSRETTVWVWRSAREESPRKVLVRFELGRSRDDPKRMLGDWKGVLVSDGTNLPTTSLDRMGSCGRGAWRTPGATSRRPSTWERRRLRCALRR